MRSVIIALLLIAGFCPDVMAQNETMNITVRVQIHNKKDDKTYMETVKWGAFPSIEQARKVAKTIEGASDDVIRKNKVTRNGPNGRFRTSLFSGMAIVVIAQEGETLVFPIVAGKTEYHEIVEVNRLGGNVGVTGKKKRTARTVIIDSDNGKEMFKIQIPIDKKYISDNSRIILQTYAVDCQNEDTVANLIPIVYEGDKYHQLQDRRKAFSYEPYDSLWRAYNSNGALIEEESNFLIDTAVVYEKKDINRSYKGPTHFAIEDYHKVYHTGAIGGSCLRIKPFKFLDFSVAIPEMELTQDFYEEPDMNTTRHDGSLNLKFVVGRDVLTEDSVNDIERAKLAEVLHANRETLVSASIIGTASPDGDDNSNRALAQRRAIRARQLVSPYVPNRIQLGIDTHLYTWEDVAQALENRGKKVEGAAIREAIKDLTNERQQDQAVYKLEFYKDIVKPVLEEFRVMKYTYGTYVQKVLTSDEVVEAYYKHKPDYLSGKKTFSNGDFFNLFATLSDSADLDTVTRMAYKQIMQSPDYYMDRMAPYVICRMERLNQRNGVADTTTLAAFIDDSLGFNVPKRYGDIVVKLNRPDIIVAQALSFFQLQKFGRAKGYIEDLRTAEVAPSGIDKLAHFMNIKEYYGQEDALSGEQYSEYEAAKNFLLSSSNENKAILFTEIPEWSTPQEAEDYVNLLDDDNPKKWYLKGLLWARRTADPFDYTEPVEIDTTQFQVLTDDQLIELSISDPAAYAKYKVDFAEYEKTHKDEPVVREMSPEDTIVIEGKMPYLAYFHHCFELQPRYRRLYFNEGHVDEELRKKFPYRKVDFPAYKKLFKLLKKRDDERREELFSEGFAGVSNADADEEGDGAPSDGAAPTAPATSVVAPATPSAAENESKVTTNNAE